MKELPLFLLFLALASPLIAAELAAEDVNSAEGPVTKTLVWPDGTRYVGGVVEGKRAGKGTIFWQDGSRFVGQFENDMRNGPGTMILPDGTVYTGFFRNDELVDTQSTITASNASESLNGATDQEMDDASTSQALGDTELPMEADSIAAVEEPAAAASSGVTETEPDLAPQLTASKETYTADIEASEPVSPDTQQEPAAIQIAEANMDSAADAADDYSLTAPFDSDVTEVTPQVEEQLMETIRLWAAAWQDQNVVQYLANYGEDFAVPGRLSRRNWEAQRRSRLKRPSFIKLDIDFQRYELVEPNVVDVFFRQAYRSNTYSDLADKVLRMKKIGTDWKILIERSR